MQSNNTLTFALFRANKFFYLSVLVQNVSKKAVGVREPLRACALPYTDHSVLLSMQNTALKFNVELKSSGKHTGLECIITI